MKKSTSQLYLHGTRSGAKAPLARRYDSKFKPGAAYREAMPDLMDAEDTLLGAPVVIPQVGVSNFRLPLRYKAAGGRILDLETSVTGTVSVDASQKGINMSRILRSFYARGGAVFSLEALEKILSAYRKEVGALEARVKLAISYPILQHALRSGLEGYQYYAVSLEGSLDREGRFRRFMEFDFVYSSACPCSAELSEHARAVRGAYAVPHSQRSRARVRVEVDSGTKLRIEDLQKHCLAALKTETQVMVKREDEQAFAELNGTELKFVEDALRLLYGQLASDKRIADFRVVCSHQESLHSHDAVGAIAKGVRGGMNAECMDFQSLA